MAEFTVKIVYDPRRIMPVERFVLEVLSGGDAFVYQLFQEFNRYRDTIKKKPAKYGSFRVTVSNMKKNRYIRWLTPNRQNIYDPSKYGITDRGRQRLDMLREKL